MRTGIYSIFQKNIDFVREYANTASSMSSQKTLGARIRELRQARKFSMRELAARSKLKSVAFIADLENGFRFPSVEVLANLANALEVPLVELRVHDRRAPLQEIAMLTEKDTAWAGVFRQIVDAANAGELTPKSLAKLLSSASPDVHRQPALPLNF